MTSVVVENRPLTTNIVTSGLIGNCQYAIQCGTDLQDLQACGDGGGDGTCGMEIIIRLQTGLFTSNTLYYYTVTVTNDDITVKVQGNFTTNTFGKLIVISVCALW